MKNLILLLSLFAFTSCTAQNKNNYTITDNPIQDTVMFQKFDFELDENNYTGYDYVDDSYNKYGANGYYKLKNGGAFYPVNYKEGCWYNLIPSPIAFYSISYGYYKNGNTKSVGKIAGFKSGIQIGIWKYYDENGVLIREVDEDKKLGLWSFEKVLEQLNKDKVIDLATGRNREANHLRFYFDEVKKLWKVKVFWKMKNEDVEKYWEYIFDSNTGKYTRDWYEEYTEEILLMMGDVKNHFMPPLKNSKQKKQKKAN